MTAPFTNIPDIDRVLLLSLPYPDLLQACQVNRVVQAMCSDPHFWKQRILNEYGIVSFPDNYQEEYRRLKEFQADPELFQKYSQYRDAFKDLFDNPEIFYEELQQRPNFTLTDHAFDYGFLNDFFELAKHRLRQGMKIISGVYREMFPNPVFPEEVNLMSQIALEYPQMIDIVEFFASDPSMIDIQFKLVNDVIIITAVKTPMYQNQEEVRLQTIVPAEVGLEIIREMITIFLFIDENGMEITPM